MGAIMHDAFYRAYPLTGASETKQLGLPGTSLSQAMPVLSQHRTPRQAEITALARTEMRLGAVAVTLPWGPSAREFPQALAVTALAKAARAKANPGCLSAARRWAESAAGANPKTSAKANRLIIWRGRVHNVAGRAAASRWDGGQSLGGKRAGRTGV